VVEGIFSNFLKRERFFYPFRKFEKKKFQNLLQRLLYYTGNSMDKAVLRFCLSAFFFALKKMGSSALRITALLFLLCKKWANTNRKGKGIAQAAVQKVPPGGSAKGAHRNAEAKPERFFLFILLFLQSKKSKAKSKAVWWAPPREKKRWEIKAKKGKKRQKMKKKVFTQSLHDM
jgi:hypothetical protein